MSTKFLSYMMALVAAGSDLAPAAQAATPAGVVTTVTATYIDPNGVVPAFNVAKNHAGAGIDTYDIGVPVSVLQQGSVYVFSTTLQVVNFSGTCKASYELHRGKTALISGVLNKGWACQTGDYWGWSIYSKNIPASPGPATLSATVSFGKQRVTLSVPVVIQ